MSDRDIAALENDLDWQRRAEKVLVRDVCTVDVYAVELDTPLDEVLVEMADRRLGSVIVTRKGELAGLFTVTDACRCYAADLRART